MHLNQWAYSSGISTTLTSLPNVAAALSTHRTLVADPKLNLDLQWARFHDTFDHGHEHEHVDVHSSNIITSFTSRYDEERLSNIKTIKRKNYIKFPPRGGGQEGPSMFSLGRPSRFKLDTGGGLSQSLVDTNFGNNIRFNFGDDGDGDGGGDSYSEVYYDYDSKRGQSPSSKVTSSLFGLVVGPFVVFASCVLLWKNEKWAIKTHRSLNEALNTMQTIHDWSAHDAISSHQYDGKLIYYTGHITVGSNGGAQDYDFQLKRNAISIQRKVEIYQWVESRHETSRKLHDGRTERRVTYSYNKRWTSRPVASENFRKQGYNNWGHLPFESDIFYADNVFLGPFQLHQAIFGNRLHVDYTIIHPREIDYIPNGGMIEGTSIYFPSSSEGVITPTAYDIETTIFTNDNDEDRIVYRIAETGEMFHTKKEAQIRARILQRCSSSTSKVPYRQLGSEPQIGDVRILFSEVKCKPASVVGKLVSGNKITTWQSEQGEGYDVSLLQYGKISANELVQNAQSKNKLFSWGLRGAGFLISFIGFSMTTSIISATASLTFDWIPLIGPMARSIIDIGLTFANFILASSLSLMVASLSWLFYRPFIGAPLLIGSFGMFYMASQMGVGNVLRWNNMYKNLNRE